MLHEISSPASKTTAQWDVPAAICGEFGAVSQGLYVFLFANESETDVYDNTTAPKIVVPKRGRSIRAGKFEQGLSLRLQNYNAHLHRVQPDGSQRWVLQESFRTGYVLDLTGAEDALAAPERVFEKYWTDAVNAFLDANRLLAVAGPRAATNGWRFLRAERWSPALQAEFRSYLADVSARVFAMIDVGRLPLARRMSMPVPAGNLDMEEWIPEQRLA